MPYEVVHHDNLESVLGLSGHDGTVLQTLTYDPFGNIISQSSSNNNQLHYTGREQDPDTGLYNYRARIYDPTTGRFVTEDPKHFAAGVNFYVYVQNNPINANDPYGLLGEQLFEDLPELIAEATETAEAIGTRVNQTIAQATAAAKTLGTQVSNQATNLYNWGMALVNTVLTHPYDVGETLNKTTGIATEVLSDITNTEQPPSASADIPSLYSYEVAAGNALIKAGVDLYQNNYNSQNNQASNPTGSFGFSDNTSGNPAAGGFLIYPNMPNTNMMQSVYSK